MATRGSSSILWPSRWSKHLQAVTRGQGSFDHAKWEQVADQVDDWRLLLQIDSDDTIEAMWGDVGTIYWMARNEDLAFGRWENGMFNFQCS